MTNLLDSVFCVKGCEGWGFTAPALTAQAFPRVVKGVKGKTLTRARTAHTKNQHHKTNSRNFFPYTRPLHTLHALHMPLIPMVCAVKGKSFALHTKNSHPKGRRMSKNLRADMPSTAAFIDQMREAFGAEGVNSAIRAGLIGQDTFYARENGHEIGTKRVGGVEVPATVYEPLEAIQARMKRVAR